MRARLLALTALMAGMTMELRGETLGDVLAAHGVPARVLPAADLRIPVARASASWSAKGSIFLMAYYNGETESLPNVFHVVRYVRQTQRLQRTGIRGMDAPFHGFDAVMDEPSTNCMGSVLSISEEDGFVTIETRVSPSASCTLFLSQDLKFRVGLYGWVLGRIKHELVFEQSRVHFASVHEARLAVFDIDKKRTMPIYPTPLEGERQLFSAQLERHMPSAEWCAQQNNPCDPETFTSDIDHLKVDVRNSRFTFDVQMTAEGFGPEAERLVRSRTVHYVCEKLPGSWRLSSGLGTDKTAP